jgi:hypothetical protein
MNPRFVSYIRKQPFIHRRTHAERPVRYNPDQKQHDERFPEYKPEEARDQKRNHDSRSDINDRDIKDPVRMCAFFRATKYIFVTTEIERFCHLILIDNIDYNSHFQLGSGFLMKSGVFV